MYKDILTVLTPNVNSVRRYPDSAASLWLGCAQVFGYKPMIRNGLRGWAWEFILNDRGRKALMRRELCDRSTSEARDGLDALGWLSYDSGAAQAADRDRPNLAWGTHPDIATPWI